ncbi:hypothetical protein [Verrucomicrobium sp. BvORR034]|uniref:hypothetical protein n=1 Tax=Verrucomicrobium sp. BvORR034 TaxID=1396418 RepID=UPI000678F9F4|nr:hypothetical protein [Verrucomicrobium sp. BvORR034]
MANDKDSEAVFVCIGVVLAIAAALAVLYVLFVFVLPATLALGGVLGLGIAGTNYARAFINNVRPEGDHDGMTAKIILGVLTFAALSLIVIAYFRS